MSAYQAIYRKYRPKQFADVFGQRHITDTLINQLKSGRVSHAYLFTGTRGTGKTTCAKLLARAVNCENLIDGDPCGVCPACQSILSGSAVDVTELDAASNTGVDNMRSILDEVIYPPSELTKRVYIIDEVHMLSIGAFNALLKTLEEPPPHVLFILATTELHKVPATILSRCQRFDFRRVEPKEIAANISHIADAEGIQLTGGAIGLIARLADGSVRDSLSILERCVAEGSDTIDEEAVLSCMGTAAGDSLVAVAGAIGAYDAAGALTQINTFYQNGRDLRSTFDALCTLMRDVLVVKTLPTGWEAFVSPGADINVISSLAGSFSAARITEVIHTLSDTMNRMQRSGGNRTEAELAVISLCSPKAEAGSAAGTEDLLARLNAMEQKLAQGIVTAAPQEKPAPKETKPRQESTKKAEDSKKDIKPSEASGTLLAPDKQKALLDRLKPALSRSAHVTLTMASLSLHNGKLRIVVDDDLSARVLGDHNVKNILSEAAAAVLGTTLPAEVMTEAAAGSAPSDDMNKSFDLLAELGRASGIDVNIK